MEDIIGFLKIQILSMREEYDKIGRSDWQETQHCVLSVPDAQKVIDFYEAHKREDEPLPNVPDITPEWDKIDQKYNWVAIDESGYEFSYSNKPEINDLAWWTHPACDLMQTGRKFDMSVIDFRETLSKRPAK